MQLEERKSVARGPVAQTGPLAQRSGAPGQLAAPDRQFERHQVADRADDPWGTVAPLHSDRRRDLGQRTVLGRPVDQPVVSAGGSGQQPRDALTQNLLADEAAERMDVPREAVGGAEQRPHAAEDLMPPHVRGTVPLLVEQLRAVAPLIVETARPRRQDRARRAIQQLPRRYSRFARISERRRSESATGEESFWATTSTRSPPRAGSAGATLPRSPSRSGNARAPPPPPRRSRVRNRASTEPRSSRRRRDSSEHQSSSSRTSSSGCPGHPPSCSAASASATIRRIAARAAADPVPLDQRLMLIGSPQHRPQHDPTEARIALRAADGVGRRAREVRDPHAEVTGARRAAHLGPW